MTDVNQKINEYLTSKVDDEQMSEAEIQIMHLRIETIKKLADAEK